MLQLFGVLSVVWLVFGITLSVSMCIECSKSKAHAAHGLSISRTGLYTAYGYVNLP